MRRPFSLCPGVSPMQKGRRITAPALRVFVTDRGDDQPMIPFSVAEGRITAAVLPASVW
jgi:hypothetical protein